MKSSEWLRSLPPVERYGAGSGPAVQMSEDLKRIVAIERRPPYELDGPAGAALVELMNERLRRPGQPDRACDCSSLGRPCITSLRPIQAWALYEAPLAGGLIAPIGVGHGKTLLDLLVAVVMGSRQAVLLIPPALAEQLSREFLALRNHFRCPSLVVGERAWVEPGVPVVHVVPYSRLSRPDATDLLERLAPDLIVADEAHKLRHRQTSTTGRVLRYWVDHPETRLVAWSGTLTARSIKDYAHLSALALKEGSPLPLDPAVVEEWATALDPVDVPADPGVLLKLEEADADRRGFCDLGSDHVDRARRAFHSRLVDTRGVVATREGSLGASLTLLEWKTPPVPAEVTRLLRELRAGWLRPDGEELIDALAVAKSAKELACGFYYRWTFPNGEPAKLIEEWFEARKRWHRELRSRLQRREAHLDSPLLLVKAAIRHADGYRGELPVWRSECWPAWRDIRDDVQPVPEAVWVDDWLAQTAAEWTTKELGIVWYEHEAFGRRVAELAKLPLHGGGAMAEQRLRAEKGNRSIVASIKAHGTGRDGLQLLFSQNLVANPPSSGATWEQLLGRTHRVGQKADEVTAWVPRHTPELRDSLDDALRDARYIHATMGLEQKLLAASLGW